MKALSDVLLAFVCASSTGTSTSTDFATVELGILLHRLDAPYQVGRGDSTTVISIPPLKPAKTRASRIFLFVTSLHGV